MSFKRSHEHIKNMIVASILRNEGHNIEFIEKEFNMLGTHFPTIKYFIYENNSNDDSSEQLQQWSLRDTRVNVFCNTIDEDETFKARTMFGKIHKYERIAHARNQLMKIISISEEVNDIILFIDISMFQWPIEGILENVNRFKTSVNKKTVILANVVEDTGIIMSPLSFRDEINKFGPEIQGLSYWTSTYTRVNSSFFSDSSPHLVYSYFGGLLVSDLMTLKEGFFSAFPTKSLHTYYSKHSEEILHDHVSEDAPQYINGQYLFGEEEGRMFYYNTLNTNYPVLHPHVTFFRSLIAKGTTIVLNPDFIWKHYDDKALLV